MSKLRAYIGLAIFIAIAAAIPLTDRLLNASAGEAHHQQLLTQWQAIQPPPEAVVVTTKDSFSSWRPHQSLVSATYRTSTSNELVRKHYDRELMADGWQFKGEHQVREWGRDLGGSDLTYCKGSMEATLQFAGKQANYGWTFAFDLSWGLGSPPCP